MKKKENVRVGVERNILQTNILQHISRVLTIRKLDNLVVLAVRQEERRLLVGPILGGETLDPIAQQEIAGQPENSAKLLLASDTGEHGHCTTL